MANAVAEEASKADRPSVAAPTWKKSAVPIATTEAKPACRPCARLLVTV
jgi:hypothetical protein